MPRLKPRPTKIEAGPSKTALRVNPLRVALRASRSSRSDGNERSDSRDRFYFARASDSFYVGTLLQAAGSGAAANTRGERAGSTWRECGIASVRRRYGRAASCREQTSISGRSASHGRKDNRGGEPTLSRGVFKSRGRGAELEAQKISGRPETAAAAGSCERRRCEATGLAFLAGSHRQATRSAGEFWVVRSDSRSVGSERGLAGAG